MRYLFGVLFSLAGLLHFTHSEMYLKIMPPYLPLHRELVYLSGAIVFILGILLMIPATRRMAAMGDHRLLDRGFPREYLHGHAR